MDDDEYKFIRSMSDEELVAELSFDHEPGQCGFCDAYRAEAVRRGLVEEE